MMDRLTGLPGRKELERRLRDELERNASDGGPVSVVSLDIDHFKLVNDTYGHDVGDEVIRRVAETLRSSVDNAGMCARYGGEEFVVLLPGIEREEAFLLAERIRVSVEGTRGFGTNGAHPDFGVTVSAGVAGFPTDGASDREIFRKVDQALYRAKKTGRNKVCIAQEEKMATRTTHYTGTQLERLSRLAREENLGEAALLREALDDLLTKYRVADIES